MIAITDNTTNRDMLLAEIGNLKTALDRFSGLLLANKPAGYYRSLHKTLQRHSREIAGLVEVVDSNRPAKQDIEEGPIRRYLNKYVLGEWPDIRR